MTRNSALAWLGHPATIAAVIVLLLNDHFLKYAWPGVITGKLSDVAGMLVAPPLLALLVLTLGGARMDPHADRVALTSLLATGVGFGFAKVSAVGASLASQAWSLIAGPSEVLADATDLVALPALGFAWWVWRRTRHTAVTLRAAGTARVLIVVPITMFAVVATAAPLYFDARAVGVQDGVIVVDTSAGLSISRDGGTTWKWADAEAPLPGSPTIRPDTPGPALEDGAATWPVFRYPKLRKKACVPGRPEHCYRVDPPALHLSETFDGGRTWTTAWQAPSEMRQQLMKACSPDYHHLSSGAVTVLARPGGMSWWSRTDATESWSVTSLGPGTGSRSRSIWSPRPQRRPGRSSSKRSPRRRWQKEPTSCATH